MAGLSPSGKWALINNTIYNEKITIFALQETHMDEDLLKNINECFSKNLHIIASADPTCPTTSAGTAFVINKAKIRTQECQAYELIPGRAHYLSIKWLNSCTVTVANIYAPNNRAKHDAFWHTIEVERIAHRLPIPNFTLGDFNVTKELIDRAPPKETKMGNH